MLRAKVAKKAAEPEAVSTGPWKWFFFALVAAVTPSVVV
jgi:hypothetical protein